MAAVKSTNVKFANYLFGNLNRADISSIDKNTVIALGKSKFQKYKKFHNTQGHSENKQNFQNTTFVYD